VFFYTDNLDDSFSGLLILMIDVLTFMFSISIRSEIGYRFCDLLFSGDCLKFVVLYGLAFALLSFEFLSGDV
jgi:hypothetical protein